MKRLFQYMLIVLVLLFLMKPLHIKAATPLPNDELLTEVQIKNKTFQQQYEFLLSNIEATNEYYFNNSSLTDFGKLIYRETLNYFMNLDINNYKQPVEFNLESSDEVIIAEGSKGVIAFLSDYKVFYWYTGAFHIEIRTIGTKQEITITLELLDVYEEVDNSFQEDLEELLINREIIKTAFLQEKSTYHQIKVIHDWLVNNNKYTKVDDTSHSPVGALVSKYSPVCEAYAEAFLVLANYLNLEAVYATGLGTNNTGDPAELHAWNYIKILNTWYFVDVTWDDPISSSGDILSHDYFLKVKPSSHSQAEDGVMPTPFTTEDYPTTSLAEFEVEGNDYYYFKDGNPVKGYDNVKIKGNLLGSVKVTYYNQAGNKLASEPTDFGIYYIIFEAEGALSGYGSFKVYFEIVEQMFKVTFYDYLGNVLKTQYVKENKGATAPEALRNGYKHLGWNQEFDNVESDLEINPIYEEITIVFKDLEGNNLEITLTEITAQAIIDTDYERNEEGFIFIGWQHNEKPIDPEQLLTDHLELTPLIEEVKINVKGGTLENDKIVILDKHYGKEEITLVSENQFIVSQKRTQELDDNLEYQIEVVVGSKYSSDTETIVITLRQTKYMLFGIPQSQLILYGVIGLVVLIIAGVGISLFIKKRD